MTYAFLISLLGTAGITALAFYWRSQRDKARADARLANANVDAVRKDMAKILVDAVAAGRQWDEERAAFHTTLESTRLANTARMEQFRALVSRCGSSAGPVLLPWIDRLLSGEGSPSGVARRDDEGLSDKDATPRLRTDPRNR